MKGLRQRIFGGPSVDGRKDKDEDLLLFHELHRREKERILNLLQPVSDEFDLNSGNHPLYRLPSARKGSANGKHDYDWLKTPPATPLFPSLEMEAINGGATSLMAQMEIPAVLQPMKYPQFSSKSEPATPNRNPISLNPKPSSSSRPVTPKRKPHVSVPKSSNTKIVSDTNEKSTKPASIPIKKPIFSSLPAKPTSQKEISSSTYTDTNHPKSRTRVSDAKPRSRGVSPSSTPRIPAAAIHGFSSKTPSNPRTEVPSRPSSASKGRPKNPIPKADTKQDVGKQRRQSCSPKVMRGRNVVDAQKESGSKGKILAGNGSMVISSRMVVKVMNARKPDVEEEKRPTPK